jgi:predicted nucleic acid-binding Zn ribbon protein
MARYEFRCPRNHATEVVAPMSEGAPPSIQCEASVLPLTGGPGVRCGEIASRVFTPLAAIHFFGKGFYATDVNSAQRRRRRPNAGDDLHREHDPTAAAIARSL